MRARMDARHRIVRIVGDEMHAARTLPSARRPTRGRRSLCAQRHHVAARPDDPEDPACDGLREAQEVVALAGPYTVGGRRTTGTKCGDASARIPFGFELGRPYAVTGRSGSRRGGPEKKPIAAMLLMNTKLRQPASRARRASSMAASRWCARRRSRPVAAPVRPRPPVNHRVARRDRATETRAVQQSPSRDHFAKSSGFEPRDATGHARAHARGVRARASAPATTWPIKPVAR